MDVKENSQQKNCLACVRCGSFYPRKELIYNMVCSGFMCLHCYHEMFPHTPLAVNPVQLKGYRERYS